MSNFLWPQRATQRPHSGWLPVVVPGLIPLHILDNHCLETGQYFFVSGSDFAVGGQCFSIDNSTSVSARVPFFLSGASPWFYPCFYYLWSVDGHLLTRPCPTLLSAMSRRMRNYISSFIRRKVCISRPKIATQLLAGWEKKTALNDSAAWTISPTGAREPTHELPLFQTALNQ